jgi:hypothetical protein
MIVLKAQLVQEKLQWDVTADAHDAHPVSPVRPAKRRSAGGGRNRDKNHAAYPRRRDGATDRAGTNRGNINYPQTLSLPAMNRMLA